MSEFSRVTLCPTHLSPFKSRKEIQFNYCVDAYDGKYQLDGLPIYASNMDTVTTLETVSIYRQFGVKPVLHKHVDLNKALSFAEQSFLSFGEADFDTLKSLADKGTDLPFICLDVANGHRSYFHDFVVAVRNLFPQSYLIAGNFAHRFEAELPLYQAADMIKFGIGPSLNCATRNKTGIGISQVQIAQNNQLSSGEFKPFVGMCDGGIREPGDITKALCLGYEAVMIGGMFQGHRENSHTIFKGSDGREYARVYGMASKAANEKYNEGLRDYKTSEGWEREIPFKGELVDTLQDMLGGLKSAATYIGSADTQKWSSMVQVYIT